MTDATARTCDLNDAKQHNKEAAETTQYLHTQLSKLNENTYLQGSTSYKMVCLL